MANKRAFQMSVSQRRQRRFSDNFKQQKVIEIELGRSRVSEVSRQYEVCEANVYRWIRKFGTMKKKTERVIIETQSDTQQLLELKKRIAELERIVGQKQIQIDFKEKMIELAEQTYGVDIKKKFTGQPSSITGTTESKLDAD